MKTLYALVIALLLATTAQAQSQSNPVGEKATESEIMKNERWRTFYDSLNPAEQQQFVRWWRAELSDRKNTNPVDPRNTTEYNREFRQGLQHWYRDEVPAYEQKREMQTRYNELWDKRQESKAKKEPYRNPDKKTTLKRYDVKGDPRNYNTGTSRYYRQ